VRSPDAPGALPGDDGVARKEVITVPAELLTKEEQTASQPDASSTAPEDELREWARSHVERVRRLKLHVAAFLLGMVVLTPLWALVEWSDNGGFKRFSFNDEGIPGEWEPWILYVALIWGLVVAIMALKVHFDRPATESEIDRELRRLDSRG
jgi:2TM domain